MRTSCKSLAFGALLAAFAPFSLAQSSVTLSGVVDLSLRNTHNAAGSLTSMASGSNSTSRLQFNGKEDLGDGAYAAFWLEGSFLADTGAGGFGPGLTFDRRSTVSLGSKTLGEVRLGREWTPVFYGFVFSDPFITVGVGSAANFLSTASNTAFVQAFGLASAATTLSRSSNALQYWLPDGLGGVYGNAMYSFGENANAANSFDYRGARLGWRNTAVDVSVFAGSTKIDAANTSLRQQGLFGAYNFGGPRLAASVTQSKYQNAKSSHLILGLTVPVQAFLLKASYNYVNQSGRNTAGASIDANDVHQLGLGVDYNLSKRTALYAIASRLNNKGAANFAVPGGPAGVTGGSSSSGYELGLRHNF